MGELVAALGWRGAAQALVALPLLFAPLLLLVVDDPAARGLNPMGSTPVSGSRVHGSATRASGESSSNPRPG